MSFTSQAQTILSQTPSLGTRITLPPSCHQTSSSAPSYPLKMRWGPPKNNGNFPHSPTAHREPWTLERLKYECSILLGMSIDQSTFASNSSALNSYLTFCKSHGLPVEPTPQTLSYYTTFQSFHINPKSVNSYLSRICNQLEPYFPDVRHNRKSALVNRTLAGAKHYHGTPTK